MNKLHNYIFILALLTWFSQTTFSQEAEFIKLNKDYILHEDGSQEFRCYKELNIFTHTAMNSTYGETFIVYNPDFQELKIHSCFTKQKDGTIIKAPENAFVEVLPRFAADAPAYNQLREMVVVHTGLDLGATIYLDYSILTKPGYFAELDMDEILQETSPVREYNVSISIPANKILNHQLYASTAKVSEKSLEAVKTYSWKLKSIPAASRMPYLPQNKENISRLTANTYRNGLEAVKALSAKLDKSIALESETFAQFITENSSSDKEKADKILQHVTKNINTTPVPYQHTAFNFRNADAVLRSAYGTEIEKNNLLNKMLNAVGISSEIVLYYPSTVNQPIGGISSIKHFGIKAIIDGEETFLSGLSTNPEKPELRKDLDRIISLKGEKISITKNAVAVYNESKETELDIKQAQYGYLVYSLPPTNGFDKWNITNLNSKRADLFEIPSIIQDKITYIITIPEGVKLISQTEPITITTPQGKISRTINTKENKLEVNCSIELHKTQYTPTEYNNVKKIITEWNANNYRQLLFKID